MTVLTADDVADVHRYLATARPDWSASLAGIKSKGGPWACEHCDGPSYLSYRCSRCGRDLCTE